MNDLIVNYKKGRLPENRVPEKREKRENTAILSQTWKKPIKKCCLEGRVNFSEKGGEKEERRRKWM